MQRQDFNALMDLKPDEIEGAMGSFFADRKINHTPLELEESLELSIDEVNEVPDSFRAKLQANQEPMSEQRMKEIYVFAERLRKKGMPESVIRKAVKREFQISEYQ